MVQEAQLITTWWNETQSLTNSVPATLIKYVRSYLDKYVGRGLPVPYDMLLVMRNGGADTAADAIKVAKEAKKAQEKAAEEMAKLKSELGQLKADYAQLKSSVRNATNQGGDPGGPGSGTFKGKCHYCGEKGHRIGECPKKAKDDAAKKASQGKDDDDE